MWRWAILLVLVLLLLFFIGGGGMRERMSDWYLDQMAMRYPDPTTFIYTGDERDVAGMSGRDYYLENKTNYLNGVAPPYFEGAARFVDQTDYLGMPAEYRPRPRTLDYTEAREATQPEQPEQQVAALQAAGLTQNDLANDILTL